MPVSRLAPTTRLRPASANGCRFATPGGDGDERYAGVEAGNGQFIGLRTIGDYHRHTLEVIDHPGAGWGFGHTPGGGLSDGRLGLEDAQRPAADLTDGVDGHSHFERGFQSP